MPSRGTAALGEPSRSRRLDEGCPRPRQARARQLRLTKATAREQRENDNAASVTRRPVFNSLAALSFALLASGVNAL